MADRVLGVRVHLAEGLVVAGWHEDGIVAEAFLAPRWPGNRAVNPADERLGMAIRPGEAQGGDEPGAAILLVAELVVHRGHGSAKVLRRAGPTRRQHPGLAAERGDAEAGIV